MKRYFWFFVLFLVSCSSSPQELFDTAELELLQSNLPHAEQLYLEIVEKHPQSEFAEKAKLRLDEINKKTNK